MGQDARDGLRCGGGKRDEMWGGIGRDGVGIGLGGVWDQTGWCVRRDGA